MSTISEGGAARSLKLASLPAGIASRSAVGFGRRLLGADGEEVNAELVEKAAAQLFQVLGELKGGAMKFGQALSVFEAAIPEEFAAPYREALTKLQDQAPPMPTKTVHRVLDEQLGTLWRERFSHFDDQPTAAASIGQVHRATWSDGRDVAVKIQYPGADTALRSDLAAIKRVSRMAGFAVPGQDIGALVDELIARTEMELDYRIEATSQRLFAKAFRKSPHFQIPRVVASAPKVVVSEWMEGVPLRKIIATGTQEQRTRMAGLLVQFPFASLKLTEHLHADPHPGNFMLVDGNRMGVIDFGAVAPLAGGIPPYVGEMARLMRDRDADGLTRLLKESNVATNAREVEVEDVAVWIRTMDGRGIPDPLKAETFRFSREWLQTAARQSMAFTDEHAKAGRNLSRAITFPPQYLMVARVISGMTAICAQLESDVPVRRILETWLPGFGEN